MNVLIDNDGVGRISDFGLGTLAYHQELGELTRTTVRDGPERYMAPERFASADDHPPVLTFEGDIYSLGCVALEVCTDQAVQPTLQFIIQFIGRVYPFQRFSSDHEVIDAILSGLPPALRAEIECKSPAMTEFLWNLLSTCWSSQPSSRPDVATVIISVVALNLIGVDDIVPVAEGTCPDARPIDSVWHT